MTKSVFACVDESLSAKAVTDWAAWIASRGNLSVALLHALEKPAKADETDLTGAIGLGSREALLRQMTELDEQRNRVALEHGKLILVDAKSRLKQKSSQAVEAMQKHGDLVETLIDLENEMHLLIMGRRGESSDHPGSQLGSHLESAIRSIHRPVLVSMKEFVEPKSLLIAYDGSQGAMKCVEFLKAHPGVFQGLAVHLVTVGEAKPAGLEHQRSYLEGAGFVVTINQMKGEFDQAIDEYSTAHGIGLVMMGAYSHSAVRRFFMGSTTTRMLQKTKVPLLLVR